MNITDLRGTKINIRVFNIWNILLGSLVFPLIFQGSLWIPRVPNLEVFGFLGITKGATNSLFLSADSH